MPTSFIDEVAKKVRRNESWDLLLPPFFYERKINNNKKMQEEGITIFHYGYGYEFYQPICTDGYSWVFFVFKGFGR